MVHSLLLPSFRRIALVGFLCFLWVTTNCLFAQTPPPAAPEDSNAKPAPAAQAPASGENQEVSSHDTPTTFKVRVNLVLIRVVVRDSHGKLVPNLKNEDFQLYDNRKLQTISSFSLSTP